MSLFFSTGLIQINTASLRAKPATVDVTVAEKDPKVYFDFQGFASTTETVETECCVDNFVEGDVIDFTCPVSFMFTHLGSEFN